jgi:hypothetical protein
MSTLSPLPLQSTLERTRRVRTRVAPFHAVAAAGMLLGSAAMATAAAAASQDRYGYYRVVDGNASVVQQGSTVAAQENQPLLTGDQLWTGRGSRVELVLADGTILRVAGDSQLRFDRFAYSGDASGDANLLTLERGELQLVTTGRADTRIDTDNATVYVRDSGSLRVESRNDTTLVVVRRGAAELRTRRGATAVREDEEAWVEGEEAPEVDNAGTWDGLERWASTLDDQYRRARWDDDYVDSSLGYSAVRMADYGSWVTYSNRRYWRPRVGSDWSPYRHGRWGYTPSGLTWISYEPWGWVPYHYGSWDYAPGFGWIWYPGRTYAPAWVYWYWGPSQVGWCPIGYYSHFYGPRFYAGFGYDFHFGFGVHGWAGGPYRNWNRWNFVPCRNLYDPRLAYFTRSASQLGAAGVRELPRGIISTYTRGLRPGVATRPSGGMQMLATGGVRMGDSGFTKPLRQLPDVTRFVARDPGVSAEVGRSAMPLEKPNPGDAGRRAVVGGRPWVDPAAERGDAGTMPGRPHGEIGGVGSGTARGQEPGAVGRGGGGDWRGGDNGRVGGSKPMGSNPMGKPGGDEAPGTSRGSVPRGTQDWRGGGGLGASQGGYQGGSQGSGQVGGSKPIARPRGEVGGDSPNGRGRSGSSAQPRDQGRPDDGQRNSLMPRAADWRGAAKPIERPRDAGAGTDPQRPQGRVSIQPHRPDEGDQVRGGAFERTPQPDDQSWRGGGRDDGTERPPVRRVVEGVRSNRSEPGRPEPLRPEPDGGSFDSPPRRVAPPANVGAPPAYQRPPEPSGHPPQGRIGSPDGQRGTERSHDGGRDRGNGGGRSSGDSAEHGDGGHDRGGAKPRQSSGDSDEPQR